MLLWASGTTWRKRYFYTYHQSCTPAPCLWQKPALVYLFSLALNPDHITFLFLCCKWQHNIYYRITIIIHSPVLPQQCKLFALDLGARPPVSHNSVKPSIYLVCSITHCLIIINLCCDHNQPQQYKTVFTGTTERWWFSCKQQEYIVKMKMVYRNRNV